jgi:hypothetical protein
MPSAPITPRWMLLVVAVLVAPFLVLPTTGGLPSSQVAAAGLAATARILNYYPAQHPWQDMWTRWSRDEFDRDMGRVAATGAATVRLIVFPVVFGYPSPTTEMKGRLAEAISVAAAHRLTTQLTLFDYWDDYVDRSGSRQWSSELLSGYKGDHRVVLVEVRNEIDPGNAAAMAWARDQIRLLHSILPGTPITASTNGQLGAGGVGALKKALAPEQLDVYDLHFYGEPDSAYATFRQARELAWPSPLLIGEAGSATEQPASAPDADRLSREAEQAHWYRVVQAAATTAGLAPAAPWTLYDFPPSTVPAELPANESSFGLYRMDGTAKQAAGVVQAAFRCQPLGGTDNGDFAQLYDGGARAAAWTPRMPSGTGRVQPGGGVNGGNALLFSGTQASSAGVTSWYQVPVQPVQAGQTWRVAVDVRGDEVTGLNDLTLAWFDRSHRWLGNTSSRAVPAGGPPWQELSVVASPPAGAEAVQVHLRSSGNTGRVFFSNVTWTVHGP